MDIDHPGPPPASTRRDWDAVLEDYAARNGLPVWPVTRVVSGQRARKLSGGDDAEIVRLWQARPDLTVFEIAKSFGVSCDTIYRRVRRRGVA